jgi:hypothetical protein
MESWSSPDGKPVRLWSVDQLIETFPVPLRETIVLHELGYRDIRDNCCTIGMMALSR